MVAQRAEELVARLRTGDSSSRISALKAVRNQVIGNRQRKRVFLKLDLISTLVELLASAEGDLAVQCATVAGSLARAGSESAQALLRAGGIELLLRLLSAREQAVVEAGLRALNFYFEGCVVDQAHEAPPGLAKALALLASGNPGIAAAAARLVQHCAHFPRLKAFLQAAGAADALLPLVEGEQPEAVVAAAVPALLRFLQPPLDWRPALADRLQQRMRTHAKPDARLACAACLVTASLEHGEPQAQEARRQCLVALTRLVLDGGCAAAAEASPLAVLRRLLEGDASLQAPARDCGILQALPRRLLLAEEQSSDVGQLLHVGAALMQDSEDSRRLFVESAGDEGLAAVTSMLACEAAEPDARLSAARCLLALSRSAAYLRQLRATFAACVGPCLQLLAAPGAPGMPAAAAALLANVCLNFSPAREAVVQSGGIERLAAAAAIDSSAADAGPAAACALLALANLTRQSGQQERAAVKAALRSGGRLLALAGDADRPLQARVAAMTLLQNLAADATRAQAGELLAWAELDSTSLHRLLPPPDAWQAVPADLLVPALGMLNNVLACGGEAVLAGAATEQLGAQLAALLDHGCGSVVGLVLLLVKALAHGQGDSAGARLALLLRAGVWPKVQRLEDDYERLDVNERALSLRTHRLSLGGGGGFDLGMQVDE